MNKDELYEKLNDFQKQFIEDAYSEGLNINDIEFEKMLNEQIHSDNEKKQIYDYYKEKNNINIAPNIDEENMDIKISGFMDITIISVVTISIFVILILILKLI